MKIVAAWSNLKADISSGKGYLFLTVILLRPWKSMQGWRVLFIYLFLQQKRPQQWGKLWTSVWCLPVWCILWYNAPFASLSGFEKLYNWLVGKRVPGRRPIPQSQDWWGSSNNAWSLLSTFAKSWYSVRTADKSGGVDGSMGLEQTSAEVPEGELMGNPASELASHTKHFVQPWSRLARCTSKCENDGTV